MDPAPIQLGGWAVVADNWWVFVQGLYVTVLLTVGSLLLGFLAGFPAGATEVYGDGPMASFVRGAGILLRGTPIVVLIVLFFFGIPWPEVGSLAFGGWGVVEGFTVNGQALLAATAALGLRSAAYQSQVFRGAIQSIDEGQLEAARPANRSISSAVRASEAFISRTGQPRSLASAWAADVLPTPGEPWRTTASPCSSQVSAHSSKALRAESLPRTSDSVVGRYVSVQSLIVQCAAPCVDRP